MRPSRTGVVHRLDFTMERFPISQVPAGIDETLALSIAKIDLDSIHVVEEGFAKASLVQENGGFQPMTQITGMIGFICGDESSIDDVEFFGVMGLLSK